jgi:hypothetical protein
MAGTGAAAADAALAAYGADAAAAAYGAGATGGLTGAGTAAMGGAGTGATGGAMAFTTPSIFATGETGGMLGAGEAGTTGAGILGDGAVAEGAQAGAYSDVAGEQYAMAHPPADWMGYGKNAGKAASTYSAVNGAMGGNQPQRPPPQGRPVFQGEAPPIAQQQMQPQQNQYALALLEQQKRARGMLG